MKQLLEATKSISLYSSWGQAKAVTNYLVKERE